MRTWVDARISILNKFTLFPEYHDFNLVLLEVELKLVFLLEVLQSPLLQFS